jgi:DNA topoisomerase-1
MTTLVLLEGTGKLPSFRKYLGEGFQIEATGGHIIDLDERKMSINFENNFEPIYCIKPGKEGTVKGLKKAYANCDRLLIASDKDREGEFIAYSIAKELGIKNPERITFGDTTKKSILEAIKNPTGIDYNVVDSQKLRRLLDRIIGYEVSPILCRSLGIGNLAAGRVMSVVVKLIVNQDKKIDEFFDGESECYFCTVGNFLDGKKQIHSSLYTTDLKLQATDEDGDGNAGEEKKPTKKVTKSSKTKTSKVSKTDEENDDVNEDMETDGKKGVQSKIKSSTNAKNIMKQIVKSTFKIGHVVEKDSIRYPSSPFTTATMLQEASRKLGMSADRTTRAAQHLYEGEYVTYIRTDSTHMADDAIKSIGEFVVKTYGKDYHRSINYEVKSKNAQEAHEAIRPTDPKVMTIVANDAKRVGSDEIRLYNLIWKRSVASQMVPAKFNVATVKINISKLEDYFFITQSEEVIFPGFLAVYDMKNVEEDDPDAVNDGNDTNSKAIYIPAIGTILKPTSVASSQTYKKPPSRFNEASLINKLDLKNLGIGRPSTIPTMIKKIQEKTYVVKKDCKGVEKLSLNLAWDGKSTDFAETTKKIVLGKDTNRFVPTHLGTIVTEFLEGYFPDVMDYKFTADVEKQLDEVANGKAVWTDVLGDFYKTFEPLIKNLNSTIIPKAIMNKDDRTLGKDPITGFDVLVSKRKWGPVVAIVDNTQHEIKMAPIKEPYNPKKLTLAEALEILEFPKTLGIYLKKEIVMKVGDIGHYLDHGDVKKTGVRIPLGKLEKDVASNFSMEDVMLAMEQHSKNMDEKNKDILWQNHDAKNKYIIKEHVEHGRYIMVMPIVKPKIAKPPTFVGLPADTNLDDLTLKIVIDLVSKHYDKKKSRGAKAKKDKDVGAKVNKNDEGDYDDTAAKKPTVKKDVEKKPTVKKDTVKKDVEKKPTVKKDTVKKDVEKKPTKKAVIKKAPIEPSIFG